MCISLRRLVSRLSDRQSVSQSFCRSAYRSISSRFSSLGECEGKSDRSLSIYLSRRGSYPLVYLLICGAWGLVYSEWCFAFSCFEIVSRVWMDDGVGVFNLFNSINSMNNSI